MKLNDDLSNQNKNLVLIIFLFFFGNFIYYFFGEDIVRCYLTLKLWELKLINLAWSTEDSIHIIRVIENKPIKSWKLADVATVGKYVGLMFNIPLVLIVAIIGFIKRKNVPQLKYKSIIIIILFFLFPSLGEIIFIVSFFLFKKKGISKKNKIKESKFNSNDFNHSSKDNINKDDNYTKQKNTNKSQEKNKNFKDSESNNFNNSSEKKYSGAEDNYDNKKQYSNRKSTENDSRSPEEILGIKFPFTTDELKKAFRVQSQRFHPDKWQDKPETIKRIMEEEQKKINWAYEELKKKRKEN